MNDIPYGRGIHLNKDLDSVDKTYVQHFQRHDAVKARAEAAQYSRSVDKEAGTARSLPGHPDGTLQGRGRGHAYRVRHFDIWLRLLLARFC